MNRWKPGEAEIERLLTETQLQQLAGAQANGQHLLEKASRTLATAADIADIDPELRDWISAQSRVDRLLKAPRPS